MKNIGDLKVLQGVWIWSIVGCGIKTGGDLKVLQGFWIRSNVGVGRNRGV